MDSSNLEISLDKLPIKRLDSIDENGVERFPTDVDYEEKRVSLIRRIDFAWAVKKEEEEKNQGNKTKKKKQKKGLKDGSSSATTPWQWQSMVENLQLAHQELSVIIDLINTVEANDAVGVASMTRPKPLPNEILADLAVSTATKLQCYRHLGKYFKQSAKALEQQVAREARFYGALIRLQKNWKVKRQRPAATAPGNEGFTFDLFDSSLYDSAAVCRPSSLSTIRIDRDSTGVLSVNLPSNSCRSLHFGFLGLYSNGVPKKPSKLDRLVKHPLKEEDESSSGNASLKDTHLLLRDVHQAIFDEQVFEMVNREAFNQSLGFNVTGIQENRLQLSINPTTSIFISLQQSSQDDQKANDGSIQNIKSKPLPLDSLEEAGSTEGKHESLLKNLDIPISIAYEIYLRQIFHEHIFLKAKERPLSSGPRASTQAGKDGSSLISHFCMSLSHRIFAKEAVMLLEEVVLRVPYLHLIYHPTWHSRTSSWTVFMQVPKSILHSNSQIMKSDAENRKNFVRSEFRTKVVVNDVCISVEAESAPNVVGLFKSCSGGVCSMHKYECELDDLSVIILQQVASQIIQWLYEEAVTVGMKANRDFLCLSIELEQGEILSLVAHVDPEDSQGCISWWLVMEDSFAEERRPYMDITDGASEYRKFLGYLPVDVLYSVLMDLVSLCSGGGNH